MRTIDRLALCAAVLSLLSLASSAQPTAGSLTGLVSAGGIAFQGATVLISSPSLQGIRVAVTNEHGVYNFAALPPGAYSALFEAPGFDTVSVRFDVNLAQVTHVDATLATKTGEARDTIASRPFASLETPAVSTNFDHDTLEKLPADRTVTGALLLAPGVSEFGPNRQPSISGGPSYNNLYLLDGGVLNEILRGQPVLNYVEDAIQETTILTANVSAEYGRFTGGVVSAITRSGGNDLSGTFRDSLSSDDWTSETPFPFEAEHDDAIDEVYEATVGGRIVRDHLWFFLAGRSAETSARLATAITAIPYETSTDDTHLQGKLTGTISEKHSLVASYLDRDTEERGLSFQSVVDLRSLYDRELPQSLFTFGYTGLPTFDSLVEARYSTRKFSFVDSGAPYTDRINGTLLVDKSTMVRAWSPTFCGACEDEDRDNELFTVKGGFFLSTSRSGNHNLVAGVEDFSEQRSADNHQTGSDYRILGDLLFAGQNVYLHVEPGTNRRGTYIQWNPIPLASQGSDITTRSVFINDSWNLNRNWSFNVGLRYDENDAVDQAGNSTANDSAFSPRLGVTWDPRGDGRHRVIAGVNRYVSSIDSVINDASSVGGSPETFQYDYRGPVINPRGCEVTGSCLTSDQVIASVFAWYDANVDPATDFLAYALPAAAVAPIDGRLESPSVDEYSLAYGVQFGWKGYLRIDYVDRSWDNFYVSVTNLQTGTSTDRFGSSYDLAEIRNSSKGLRREYQGVQLQGSYRLLERLSIGGNYTWSELRGNAESETSGSATVAIQSTESYPEYLDASWNNPERALNADVEHRANLWLGYDQPLGAFGSLNFSLVERYHSGSPYYAVGSISLAAIANPGYERPPTSASYYFETGHDYRTDDVSRTDLGINYAVPTGPVVLFVQAEVLNLFDESAVEDAQRINTLILTSQSSGCRQNYGSASDPQCLAFNPMTETPVEGIHWLKSKKGYANFQQSFGEAVSSSAYQLPLTYRVSAGVRF